MQHCSFFRTSSPVFIWSWFACSFYWSVCISRLKKYKVGHSFQKLFLLSYFNYFNIVTSVFLGNYLQGPTENCQGEWAPWMNIIIIIIIRNCTMCLLSVLYLFSKSCFKWSIIIVTLQEYNKKWAINSLTAGVWWKKAKRTTEKWTYNTKIKQAKCHFTVTPVKYS